jgi:small-conductance mechanosensitive channel
MLQAIGVVGAFPQAARGHPATTTVQRPGRGLHGDDAIQQFQEVMQQLNQQLAPQVRRLDSQLRQVSAQTGPHLRQLNAQLQPHMRGIHEQFQQLRRGASERSVNATTTVTAYERSPSSTEGAAGGEGEQCMVCLDNFRAGDQIRILPCLHRFHVACIDPWLRRNCCCPNCNHRFGSQ